jgi:hypothetical protein
MLDPKFVKAHEEFVRLKASFDAGTLSSEAFEAALRDLAFEHGGRQWTIGASTGKWFASKGDSWVEATPPGMSSALPEHATKPTPHPAPTVPPKPATAPQPAPAAGATFAISENVRMRMVRWGAILLFIGVGSFFLPLIGMQFQLLNLFGEGSQQPVAIIMAIVGGILLFLARPRSGTAPQSPK